MFHLGCFISTLVCVANSLQLKETSKRFWSKVLYTSTGLTLFAHGLPLYKSWRLNEIVFIFKCIENFIEKCHINPHFCMWNKLKWLSLLICQILGSHQPKTSISDNLWVRFKNLAHFTVKGQNNRIFMCANDADMHELPPCGRAPPGVLQRCICNTCLWCVDAEQLTAADSGLLPHAAKRCMSKRWGICVLQ